MKNVLVTGSTRGIGEKIALELEKSGYRVFGCARGQCDKKNFLSIDLSNPNNAKELYLKAKEVLGRIDILINNAGMYDYCPIEKTDFETMQKMINLNFTSAFLLCSYAAEDMKKNMWGRIINIGSISGAVGEANASLYSATKSALSGLTKSLALELAQFNITINQINPGWVDTKLSDEALNKEEKEETLEIIPQRRFIEPIEIARLCKYLISEDAKGLTGQSINLCAGLSCGA